MKRNMWILGCAAVASLALALPASAVPASNAPHGSKAGFFVGGAGSAGWVGGKVKVMQFSSPASGDYGGFQGTALDGLGVTAITALSYDFQVTTPGWTVPGGGSPRLVVDFNDGGSVALNPVTPLTTGAWTHMDAMNGAVDVTGGTCGALYQAAWSAVEACQTGIVLDAFVVNDSGWISPLTVQVKNLTFNSTVYAR